MSNKITPNADLQDADLSNADLSNANLPNANLRGANLRDADLQGAYLWGADLHGSDLHGSDLLNANLHGADLHGADLWGADLRGANLWGANRWGGMPIQAGRSGSGFFVPTPDGWRLTIGCWENKTVDDLRDLIEDRVEWPQASGRERERRRPMLVAVLALCEAHMVLHEGLIGILADKWGRGGEPE